MNSGFFCRVICFSVVMFTMAVQSQTCTSYVHKDSLQGFPADLPDGYYAYGRKDAPGLFTSPMRAFVETRVPNTQNDSARSVQISDDGNWIIYRSSINSTAYLIKRDGSFKTQVPFTGGSPFYVGFYRKSPIGSEVYANVSLTQVVALKVTLSAGAPVFGSQRTILSVTNTAKSNHDYQMSVVADQIVIRTSKATHYQRLNYFTIPNNGNGTATDADCFAWNSDTPTQDQYGCSMSMSHDGSMVAFNPGWQGNGNCIPNKNSIQSDGVTQGLDHRGFCITPFRRKGVSQAMTYDQNIDVYGTSVNWAWPMFRWSDFTRIDFIQWNFSNNNKYLIGVLRGELAVIKGLWMVEWATNRWTVLTPKNQFILAANPAAYFMPTSSVLNSHESSHLAAAPIDPDDPQYQAEIIPPTGGSFHVGEIVHFKVRSVFSQASTVSTKIGINSWLPPELNRPVDPFSSDSSLSFAIPDSFSVSIGPGLFKKYSTISDSCRVFIRTYGDSPYSAYSPYFKIIGRNASASPISNQRFSKSIRKSRIFSTQTALVLSAGSRGAIFYNCQGKKVWEYQRDGRSASSEQIFIPRSLQNKISVYGEY